MKVIIIGGGIAGLSAAFLLSQNPNINIEIYEKDNDIGGQARSQFGKSCYTEYSWRIFGQTYDNINYIIKSIGATNNFTQLNGSCIVNKSKVQYGTLSPYDLFYQILTMSKDWSVVSKLLTLTTMSHDRLINEYDDINAYTYFDKNPILQTIMGPYLGLEANKISLSAFMKNVYSTSQQAKYDFAPKTTRISKYPTQESLFIPWKKYLIARGVKIFVNSELTGITVNNHIITNISINKKIKFADNYIFALSLPDLLKNSKQLIKYKTVANLNKLLPSLQLYYTINIYLSEELGKCTELIIVDMPWKPIIQKKRQWRDNYLSNCDKNIKDVWNVGFLDNNIGLLHKKFLNQCSKKEAIEEGLYQLEHSQYVQNLLKGHSFRDILVSVEDWYQFVNDKNNRLISLNPKFSTNVGMEKYMPNNHESDLPPNMYLAGYYVKTTMGGASMEASCETGLEAGRIILQKYGYDLLSDLPIQHTNQYITKITAPLTYLDQILYHNNIKPLTDFISPWILIMCMILILIAIIITIIVVIKNPIINLFSKIDVSYFVFK